jgi:hypothetical protein
MAHCHDPVVPKFKAVCVTSNRNWLQLTIALTLSLLNTNIVLAQTSYARAGWDTHMTPMGHGVKGTATILDSRTIVLTHFSYDGTAPDMYVYLGTNQSSTAFLNGLTVSPRLTRAYNDETYMVQLPVGQTLDGWNAISIWCRAVQASFGSGTFAPPNRPVLAVTRLTNAVEVKLTGEAGQKFWLLSTTNLTATNTWQTNALLTNLTGVVRYTNSPLANPPRKFFRALRF